MDSVNGKGVILERLIGNTTVRLAATDEISVADFYSRFNAICMRIAKLEDEKQRALWRTQVEVPVEEAIESSATFLGLDDAERTEIGLTNDYHMVILSLISRFDQCLSTTEIAKEWNINSGRVSRVFTGSRKKYEEYREHFEKCPQGGYRFTPRGLDHALGYVLPEIIELKNH